MTNHARSLILGLPPSESPVANGQWISPEFSPGSPGAAESMARSLILGRPTDRPSAEFVATVLCLLASDFPPAMSALSAGLGRVSFMLSGPVVPFRSGYDPVEAAVAAAPHLRLAASASPEATGLVSSRWFSASGGLSMVAVSAAALALVAAARIEKEKE